MLGEILKGHIFFSQKGALNLYREGMRFASHCI